MDAAPDRTLGFVRTVAQLARPSDIRTLPVAIVRLVLVLRWQPLFLQAERDPLSELSVRLGSITAAKAGLDFARVAATVWPETLTVARPCCPRLTPDEFTVAELARAALAGNRAGFAAAIEGFVRPERHDRLYAATIAALAALDGVGPP